MRKFIMSIFLLPLLAAIGPLNGDAAPACYHDLETTFFNNDVDMMRAYSLYRIQQSLWGPISNAVRSFAGQVPRMDVELAKQYTPNPLANPFQAQLAMQIMLTNQYQIFRTAVLQYASQSNGVINEHSITGMFNYLKSTQANRINACLQASQQ